MSSNHVDTKKHLKIYLTVYISLMILTGVTVFASYIPTTVGLGITLALIIASIKSSLVAGYFMHLIAEKKIIFWTLVLTAIFFIFLIFIPLMSVLDPIKY
ncbi:MAG: cytochrome C oxidase subunit IV family protein [Bacteroidetes bacterium]|nr:cytochrome C oxidase subunit IV family protein [Bacteroidota bacterium]